jgi:tRNA threonylcarbamoyl adenosine modification protein (Sua5/YciO/YrdC/YwlC family)
MAAIYKIYQENPQPRIISKVAEALKKGAVIVYPTDTTYGIGADINNKKAIERILQIKHASKFKALSFICDDFKNIHEYVHVSNFAFKVMKRCLPGHFTFVLEATKLVPKLMLHSRKTAGIRVPEDEFCMALVNELGNPIVSTSLPSDEGEILNDPDEIISRFDKHVDIIVEAGFVYNAPSTVVDLQNDEIEIIREGSGDISLLY